MKLYLDAHHRGDLAALPLHFSARLGLDVTWSVYSDTFQAWTDAFHSSRMREVGEYYDVAGVFEDERVLCCQWS